jgi:hypothetical protein
MISERDRMAQRADKWWRSVWHEQMLMRQQPKPLTGMKPLTEAKALSRVKPLTGMKPLTDEPKPALLSGLRKHEPKPIVGRSDDTDGEDE